MNGISCFGHYSMGELGNIKNLTLNILKNPHVLKFQKIDAGKCAIPGFIPPALPNFAIPPIPLFGGLPAFPLLCFLPPFPGIPGLSLPGISIPIPPIPFLPPIPLPIPGFALPLLPLLPFFDLGSLSFLCGLINIKLPIFDPFAGLNKLLGNVNGLINALNDFLNFCKENAQAIADTQIPPEVGPSVEPPSGPINSGPSPFVGSSGLGINVPSISDGDPSTQSKINKKQKTPKVSLANIKASPNDDAASLAIALANDGIIPPEPSIINRVANLLAPFGKVGNLTDKLIEQILKDNNIPSTDGFLGFTSLEMEQCLETSLTIKNLIQCMIDNCYLSPNQNVVAAAFKVLSGLLTGRALASVSGLEAAAALNSNGVPYGCKDATNMLKITADDIARAFFIKKTTVPLTSAKITEVLSKTGILDTAGKNVSQAQTALTPLPEIITPVSLAAALTNSIAGPASGSLKATCIAATRGITPQTLLDIDKARAESILESVSKFKTTPLVQVLAKMTAKEFERFFSDIPFPFPLSIFDVIPLLAIKFEVDDAALRELLTSFKVPGQFSDISALFNFISFVAQTISSQQSALQAIKSCESTKEGDFSFETYMNSIETTLKKYSIALPSNLSKNNLIANALKIENSFSFSETLKVLGDAQIETVEQLTFLLLATGIITESLNQANKNALSALEADLAEGASGSLSNPIRISIQSPTKIAADIDTSSINVTLLTKKPTAAGITDVEHLVIQEGIPTAGSTAFIRLDDFSQVLEIVILRISGYNESIEANQKIIVDVKFSTAFSSKPIQIPDHLIFITT